MQLKTFTQHKPHQLSNNQQQHITIARAMVNKPHLLLLNKSLSTLNYKLHKQIQNKLKTLQHKLNITFIFITHNQKKALTISNKIIIIHKNHIKQNNTPHKIYKKPKNLFITNFINKINIFNTTIIKHLNKQRVRANIKNHKYNIYINFTIKPKQKLHILLHPKNLHIKKINNNNHTKKLINYIHKHNYKNITLKSIIKLKNNKIIIINKFFNKNNPNFNHSLNQKITIN